MATLWARRVSYDSIQPGDELPILVKQESQETIGFYARYAQSTLPQGWHSVHTDAEHASKDIFGGTVNLGTATVAYVAELLEKAFPMRALMGPGSFLEVRLTEPIRPEDTITFTGEVTGKRDDNGQQLVDCEVMGSNQLEQIVARANATICFPQ